MTAPILFRGGRVVDPSQGLDEVTHLLVVDGRISGEISSDDFDRQKIGELMIGGAA
mgnify:CR=1 FL=1